VVPASPIRKGRVAAAPKKVDGDPGRARRVVRESLEHLKLEPKLATGVLYCEDNLKQLAIMPADCIDLVYLDPPFFSNRQYEVIWGDEAEVRSFEDRWAGGIQVYIEWMRDRLMEVHRVLALDGSVYLHCDPTASHYLKVMMDAVFGPQNFRSEITWKRTNVHNDSKGWSAVSDTILYYVRDTGEPFVWNPIRAAHNEAYIRSKYRFKDPNGRAYMLDNMTSPNPRPNMMYEWKGHASPTMGWRYERKTMERLDTEGRIWYLDSKDKRPRLKRYLDEMAGTLLTNVWTDIDPINSQARERLGYPTQKPEALLERIIRASSNESDIVMDPFCGCGTTISVAHQLNRRWIGIDISPTACSLMVRRLAKIGVLDIQVYGLPATVDELRHLKPFEFQNWVIDRINGQQANRRTGDKGIDGWTFFLHDPVQIKQSEHVGREVVDKFETAIERDGKKSGAIVAFSFGRGAHEEVARVRRNGVNIHLLTVTDLLERGDWAMRQLGISGGRPDLSVAPLPKFEASRHSSEELIASALRGA